MSDKTSVHESSGNVFADLGIYDPEGCLEKSELAAQILYIVQRHHITRGIVSKLLRIRRPKVSDLLEGRLDGFTIEQLGRYLNILGH